MKNKYSIKIILVIIFLTFLKNVSSQYVKVVQVIGSGTNQIDITVSVDSSANQVKFVLTGPSNKWFAIAFNTTNMTPGFYTILTNVFYNTS